MSLKITASLLISLVLATAKCDNEKDLVKAFRSNEVVPDVIPTPPAEELHIRYAKAEREVDLGNELTPMQVRDQPTVHFDAEPDGFYTLIMIDLDVPSRKNPVYREGNHWLVVNIPGNNIEKGEILTEYIGSTPPKDTGLHRYVFLVYRQPQMLTFDEPHKSNRDSNRGNFSVKKFADKYKLGQPIAGNFFEAQYDDSVPETQKQFGL